MSRCAWDRSAIQRSQRGSSHPARGTWWAPRLISNDAGCPLRPPRWLSMRVIYAQGGGGEVWSFRQGAAEVSVTVSGPLRVSAAEGVRAGVLADMGLAITSAWMFSPELASGAVRPVLTDWSLPAVDLWVVYPAGRMPTAKARAFAAFVAAVLGQRLAEPWSSLRER
jgi:DNA-binding transcriptional LysR family regulator